MNPVLLQSSDKSADEISRFAESFEEKETALLLIRQLNKLVKAVQRHRGVSMALLAGNDDYVQEFNKLRVELERRLAMLEVFASSNRLLTVADKQNLANAWVTIRNDWEDDNLNDNFELHSHLIQQLLAMIEGLASTLEPSYEGASDTVLHLYCRVLVRMIEDLARVRGTVSYMVAVGNEHGLDEVKVRFWISSIRKNSADLLAQIDELSNAGLVIYGAEYSPQTQSMLNKLLDIVESVGFLGHASLTGASTIFNMATDVIENYWSMVYAGLNTIQERQFQRLDDWYRSE